MDLLFSSVRSNTEGCFEAYASGGFDNLSCEEPLAGIFTCTWTWNCKIKK